MNSFWEADQEIYFTDETSPETIFNILCSIFNLNELMELRLSLQSSSILIKLFDLKKKQGLIDLYELTVRYLDHITRERQFDLAIFN